MSRIRHRWLAAAFIVALAAVPGCTSSNATNTAAQQEADQPQAAAPAGENEEAEEHEEEATVDPDAKGSGPEAFTVPGHSVFIDARTLKSQPPKKRPPKEEVELRETGHQGSGPEAAVQSSSAINAAPAPTISVKGLDFNTWGAGHPPDTNGAIGPNHLVQTVNTSIGIFDKTNGNRVAAFTYDDFFVNSGTAECDGNNGGDPTVSFDFPSGRWVIGDFAWIDSRRGPFFECIAVSSGSDPVASTWTFYSVPAGDGRFPDYPKFGVGHDALYFTINNFRNNSYTGAGVYALNRTTLGSPTLQVQHVTTSSSFFSLIPANIDAVTAGAPEIIASIWNGRISLWRFAVNWSNPASTTFTNFSNINVSYTSIGRISTPGEGVDSLSPRVMNKVQQRNGSLWLTHTVASGTVAGIRWYELTGLTGTPSIRQQGTFAPTDGLSRWMPSLATDKQGNMAVGYNVASRTKHPAIRYAGRLAADPLNTLGQGETSLIEGTGSPSTGNFNRWGDYSEMSVDPNDGCTFWFTTEYYEVTGADWQTRVGSFKYPGCV
jgi:hypothetical protein